MVGLAPVTQVVEQGRVQQLLVVEGAVKAEQLAPLISQTVDYGGEVIFVDPGSNLTEDGERYRYTHGIKLATARQLLGPKALTMDRALK